MPVNRPDMPEAEGFEQAGQLALPQRLEMRIKRAHGGCDRHAVVIDDDDETAAETARMVQAFESHAACHGAVADHRDHVIASAREIARHGHAEAGRNGGRAVSCAEGIEAAFAALGEAVKPVLLADRAQGAAPPGEHLVWIGLVAHIPDHAVFRRVEHIMQRDGQFDDAEATAEMTAGLRRRGNHVGAQFFGDLRQVFDVKQAQRVWRRGAVEKGCRFRHSVSSRVFRLYN